MAVEDAEENGGQSLLAYLDEIKQPARPRAAPRRRRPAPQVELRRYERPEAPCIGTTREGTPCKRMSRDPSGYCSHHLHLAEGAGVLPPVDVDAEVERRVERDVAHNPASLHLVLARVRAMIDAQENGSRAALRDSLMDIAAAATHAAREIS